LRLRIYQLGMQVFYRRELARKSGRTTLARTILCR
jgi:hypothetical protein